MANENNKSALLMIPMAVGLLIVLACSYLGLLYIYKGNIIYSASIAFFITLVLGFMVFLMIGGKERKENKGFTIAEGFSILVYMGTAIFAFFIMTHFINLELVLKDKIKDTGISKLQELNKMLVDYKELVVNTSTTNQEEMMVELQAYRMNGNSSVLKTKVDAYGLSLQNLSNAENEIVDNVSANKDRALKSYAELEQKSIEFNRERQPVFESYDRTKIQRTFYETDNKLDDNLKQLKKDFKAPVSNKKWNEVSFDFQISPRQDEIISSPLKLIKEYKPSWILPIIFGLFTNILILLPYILIGREGKRRFYRKDDIGIEA